MKTNKKKGKKIAKRIIKVIGKPTRKKGKKLVKKINKTLRK